MMPIPLYLIIFNYLTLAWGLISLGLLLLAWKEIRRGEQRRHRRLMIILTVGAWIFLATYLLKYWLPGYQPPHVPRHLIPWLALHGMMGLVPFIGATLLVWARLSGGRDFIRRHINQRHRAYGSFFAAIWCLTHLGGIINFWLFDG